MSMLRSRILAYPSSIPVISVNAFRLDPNHDHAHAAASAAIFSAGHDPAFSIA
jgi:hypothetical protein